MKIIKYSALFLVLIISSCYDYIDRPQDKLGYVVEKYQEVSVIHNNKQNGVYGTKYYIVYQEDKTGERTKVLSSYSKYMNTQISTSKILKY